MMMQPKPLQIGDCLPAVDAMQIVGGGAARWHALTIQPQHEDQVESWLSKRGVYGFHPVLRHAVRVKGRVREYDRRYLPGYVFARFPGEALQHRVLRCPWIIGAVLGDEGFWGRLDPEDLRALHSMRKVDTQKAQAKAMAIAARKVARRMASMVKVGDGAMFRAGPFAGIHCEVVELRAAGGAVVRLGVYGREVDVTTHAADLVPLRKAS